jgi:hypothetical protein
MTRGTELALAKLRARVVDVAERHPPPKKYSSKWKER